MSTRASRAGRRGRGIPSLSLAFRCLLLLALFAAGAGTPWWAGAAPLAGADSATQAVAEGHDCHRRAAEPPAAGADTGPAAAPDSPLPLTHRHGGDCQGALCECGCVLPPLLLPARTVLVTGIAPAAPQPATSPAPHAPLLNTPFRPPIG